MSANISERRCIENAEAIRTLGFLGACSLPDLWRLLDLAMRERFGAGGLVQVPGPDVSAVCCLRRDLSELAREEG